LKGITPILWAKLPYSVYPKLLRGFGECS
jgi:hypothetical protein